MISDTDRRIWKLAAKGLSAETIARKIGRPGDVERVRKALARRSSHEKWVEGASNETNS